MKKIIFFFLLFLPMVSFGQKHIDFKGIPLNGSLSNFSQQLLKKNYVKGRFYDVFPTKREFRGPFFSDTEMSYIAEITVYASEYSGNVYKVDASFSDVEEEDFAKFVELYTKKYGTPEIIFSYVPETALKQGSTYQSFLKSSQQEKVSYSSIYHINKSRPFSGYMATYSLPAGIISIFFNIEKHEKPIDRRNKRVYYRFGLTVSYLDKQNSPYGIKDIDRINDI